MKLIIMLFTVFIFFNCEKKLTNDKLSCKDFKIGRFLLINKETNKKYLIKRTKDYQTEQTFDIVTNRKIKKDRYYKISWKNDCEYVLILDTSKSQYDETDLYINSVGGYLCLIKNITDNCAILETRVESEVFTSKIYKTNSN